MFGVDSDTKNEMRLLMTFLNASAIGTTKVASTHHGYHYRVYTEFECSREKAMDMRKALGDDNNRIYFEELEIRRGITDWADTLFEAKRGRDGVWHSEEPVENVLALPFHSRIRPIKRKRSDRNARRTWKHRSQE